MGVLVQIGGDCMFCITDEDMEKCSQQDGTVLRYQVRDGLKLDLSNQNFVIHITQKIKVKDYDIITGKRNISITKGFFKKKTEIIEVPTYHVTSKERIIIMPACGSVSVQGWDCFERICRFTGFGTDGDDKIDVNFAKSIKMRNDVWLGPGEILKLSIEHPGQKIDIKVMICAKVMNP